MIGRILTYRKSTQNLVSQFKHKATFTTKFGSTLLKKYKVVIMILNEISSKEKL